METMAMPVKSKKMSENEKKWETEDDIRALKKAEEIRKDPVRMKRCMAMMEEQKNALEHTMANMPHSKMKQKMMKEM